MRIAFLMFDGMDLMDFAGPFEVFLTANRLRQRVGSPAPFRLVRLSPDGADVTAYGGVRVGVDAAVMQGEAAEVVIVPGAVDMATVTADPAIGDAVATLTGNAPVAASVCTGSFLLANAGVLDGHRWTTHWEDFPELAASRPGGHEARLVDSGPVVTAGGIACGIDLGLHLVARLLDDEPFADAVARQMDYHQTAATETD